MSIIVSSLVWTSSLPPNKKIVLLALADHARDDGSRVYPSVDYTARKCGYTPRNVQLLLRWFETQGILRAVSDKKGGRGYATVYRIVLENIPQMAPYDGEMDENYAPITEKGEKFAPIKDERVKSTTRKGEKYDTKGEKYDTKGEMGFTPISKETLEEPLEETRPSPLGFAETTDTQVLPPWSSNLWQQFRRDPDARLWLRRHGYDPDSYRTSENMRAYAQWCEEQEESPA